KVEGQMWNSLSSADSGPQHGRKFAFGGARVCNTICPLNLKQKKAARKTRNSWSSSSTSTVRATNISHVTVNLMQREGSWPNVEFTQLS
ncbi:hypothetical protein Ancab_015305, partial [Ancistrocladus abbreviatus]